MAEQKSISVVFYLNTDLKPKLNNNGFEVYPVYVRVSHNRKNTRFPLPRFTAPLESKDHLDSLTYIKEVKNAIEVALRFEIDQHGEQHSLRGFGKRCKFYLANFFHPIKNRLIVIFADYLKEIVTYSDYVDWLEEDFDDKIFTALDEIGKAKSIELKPEDAKLIDLVELFKNFEEKCLVSNWLFGDLKNLSLMFFKRDLGYKEIVSNLFTVRRSQFTEKEIVESYNNIACETCISLLESHFDQPEKVFLPRTLSGIYLAARKK